MVDRVECTAPHINRFTANPNKLFPLSNVVVVVVVAAPFLIVLVTY